MITNLYKVTATGAIQIWTIQKLWQQGKLIISYGQLHGAMQDQVEHVRVNKSGRSLSEQVELRSDSRINKQLDKGYCYSIEEARLSVGLNADKLLKPMLAQQLKNSKVDYKKCFVQYKYNGHRCLITNTGKEIIAYSRNGKTINTISHILDNLNIAPGTTLDGELYIHGMQLQDAGSLIRKIQPGNEKLEFICYDIMKPDKYENRLYYLCNLITPKAVHIAPTLFGNKISNLNEHLHNAIEDGYEGLILRTNDTGYEPGKRSKSLVKVKKWLDAEFLVTNIVASVDGWAVLECAIPSGGFFRALAPGTIEEKTDILYNQADYIGQYVNVEFFEWTNDGIPFHPVAKYFRT
jgi:ATP-dependent DNA ligase